MVAKMGQVKNGRTIGIRRQVAAMLELHERSLHLPHIKRYHASLRRTLRARGRAHRTERTLLQRWTLPEYLLDPPSGMIELKNARKIGSMQFLIWNRALPVISEIRQDSGVFSVASGRAVSAQHRILERLRSKTRGKRLTILAVPVLHFRAVMFARKKDDIKIVPLRSPMARLTLGKVYDISVVLRTLEATLANRIKVALQVRA